MTGFFEIFNPGQRHWREQRDFDKVAVVPTRKGGKGPLQIDLDDGTVVVPGAEGSGLFRHSSGPAAGQEAESSGGASAAAQLGGAVGGRVSGPVVDVAGTLRKAKEQAAEKAKLEEQRRAEEKSARTSRSKKSAKAANGKDAQRGTTRPGGRKSRGER